MLPFLIATVGCQEGPTLHVPNEIFYPEWGAYFDAHDATGTIVMLNSGTGTRHVFNPEGAHEQFLPASTFKIYNSLVALETGVVADVDSMYAWDGVERGGSWDQPQSLRTALRRSALWLFEKLAVEIGRERYEENFAAEPYGNGLVGDSMQAFWLVGPLAISANEQVAYLNKLRGGLLAFRPEYQAAVREIMILEEESEYILYGKTGWAIPESGDIGWIVGWIERGDAVWVYALNVESAGPNFDMGPARREVLNMVLDEMGLRPLTVDRSAGR